MSISEPLKPGSDPAVALSVQKVSAMVGNYIDRLGEIWVEGQLTQVSPSRGLTFLTLQDMESEVIVKLHSAPGILDSVVPKIEQGSRVIAQVKADWWPRKGTMQFKVRQIRAVGVGELMARLDALRTQLSAEGLFDQARKKPLPFLPRRVGLVVGKNSDAMHDVMKNAKRRWPDVIFEVREVAVQGVNAVRQVSEAIRELDAIEDIDVIVVSRGGGSFEDLLAFSDESLIRVVASAQTPIVSAIGHEEDKPIIDYVADYRASTPTDAARKIVPDVLQEISEIRNSRVRINQILNQVLTQKEQQLQILRNKPALANPTQLIDQRIADNNGRRNIILEIIRNKMALESAQLKGLNATLQALSPLGTLERGFSIVRDAQGNIIKSVKSVVAGQKLTIRVADGEISVTAIES